MSGFRWRLAMTEDPAPSNRQPTASPLRVLFVLGTLRVGGSERQVIEILRRLRRDRFQPLLYLVYREGELLADVPADVPVHAYWERHQPPRWNYPGRILRSQARDLADTIRKERVDLVYDRTSNMTLLASLATRGLAVKRISTVVADPRLDVAASHPRFAWMKRRLLRRAYHAADRVLAVSEGVRQGLHEFFGLPLTNITTCYNLFDLPRLDELAQASCPPFDEQRFHVVSVGRLQQEKGQRSLVEAAADVVHRRGCRQLLLWLIGNGPDEAMLRRLVEEHRLGEHVRFEGYQANPLPYLKRANLFCLPSLFEGMPNALVEAMVAGTPVLAADCLSGPREILRDGQLGGLVPPANVQALADAIEDALRHPEAWRARVPLARRHVEEHFSADVGIQRLEAIFAEVAGNRVEESE